MLRTLLCIQFCYNLYRLHDFVCADWSVIVIWEVNFKLINACICPRLKLYRPLRLIPFCIPSSHSYFMICTDYHIFIILTCRVPLKPWTFVTHLTNKQAARSIWVKNLTSWYCNKLKCFLYEYLFSLTYAYRILKIFTKQTHNPISGAVGDYQIH